MIGAFEEISKKRRLEMKDFEKIVVKKKGTVTIQDLSGYSAFILGYYFFKILHF